MRLIGSSGMFVFDFALAKEVFVALLSRNSPTEYLVLCCAACIRQFRQRATQERTLMK